MENQADVIIIGGGINGSSIAFNLLHDGFTGKVVVFEKKTKATNIHRRRDVREVFDNCTRRKLMCSSADSA
ncbi:hypothetical protein GCM10007968_23700 [Sporolactobacillus putidus]|uniref:FAD dependent oxidoreductase domain-containing protein n=1 Tax=Sporolactobacillus putidus TaxID=492735 RepID=A0A917S512_9BACL|nr:hypothetical protein GCM10007968_23700 [Sporolactobacillus putidus]